MDLVDACRKFIAIDSSPHCGTLEIAKFAAELCRQAGLRVELEPETLNGVEQANLIARPGEAAPARELLLQTHLDTVDPGPYALWTKTGANPFSASIYQDVLYGLGTADVKLDFVCKVAAARELGKRDWKMPFALAATYGEELGMAGAIKLIRKKRIAPAFAIVGEPTELRLMTAAKGMVGVEIEVPFSTEEIEHRARHDLGETTSTQSRMFRGRAAHSSAPHLGESAILKMLEYLAKLPAGIVIMEMEGGTSFNTIPAHAVLEIDVVAASAALGRESMGAKISRVLRAVGAVEREFSRYPAEGFEPSIATLNIGMIRTRADHVVMLGCGRLPPSVPEGEYEKWMASLRDACGEVGARFRVSEHKGPFRTSENSPLVESCRAELESMGLDSRCQSLSATNEANVFSRFGIPSVAIGPGQSVGNSHAPNEHVRIEQLRDAVRFYKGVIERMCL